MAEQSVQIATGGAQATSGSAGLKTQVGGSTASVSAAAEATGGIAPGNFVETDIDDELFKFNSDDTPLMQLMLRAKKVKATSPKVEHYMIDEAKSSITTVKAVEAGTTMQVVLPLGSEDQPVVHAYDTLRVRGVNGYSESGIEQPGKDLMLWVVGKDTTTGNPVVRAVNGIMTVPKTFTARFLPSHQERSLTFWEMPCTRLRRLYLQVLSCRSQPSFSCRSTA